MAGARPLLPIRRSRPFEAPMNQVLALALALAPFTNVAGPAPTLANGSNTAHATSAANDGVVDFAALAQTFLASHGLAGKTQGDIDLDAFFDEHFVRAELGVLDVRYPKVDVVDKTRVKELQDVCVALVDLQLKWLEWSGAGNDAEKSLKKDWTALRKALAGARPPAWTAAGVTIPSDVTAVLGLKADALELTARIGLAARSGAAFGGTVARAEPIQIVFTPSRREFIEFGAFVGWYDEPARGSFWTESMPVWADMYWRDRQILPLAYAPAQVSPDDLARGHAMNDREETGLVQYVAQRGMHSLCWFYFGDALGPEFESVLALDVVIALYGENNARTGTATRGNTTQARSVFIPGAPLDDGFLPKNNADSPWRETLGTDHFVKVLRRAQKSAERDAPKDAPENGSFELTSDDTSKHTLVSAPFLGAAAQDKTPPAAEFLQDYAEFYRAYKACFGFWLRTEGAAKGGKKASEELFAKLGRELLAKPELEATFASVYGEPLSSADPTKPTLETRFLAWLAKQK